MVDIIKYRELINENEFKKIKNFFSAIPMDFCNNVNENKSVEEIYDTEQPHEIIDFD